ncbi:MAG: TatD family hydrolase [Chitinophagales bacterium]
MLFNKNYATKRFLIDKNTDFCGMQLIDTHAHLYVSQFDDDRKEILQNAKNAHVSHIVLPNIDMQSADALINLWQSDTSFFTPMMGLHPCSIKDDYKNQLDSCFTYFEKYLIKIVGEIGLDYYWSVEHKQQQIDAFRAQINFAKESKMPIAVHCREAFDDILNILEDEQDGNLQGVLHCFSGNEAQAKRLIDINFYLGLGGVLTFKNSGLDKVIKNIDMKHLVLETDAPYLAPKPYRGKRNETAYIRFVADKLAEVKDISLKEVAAVTTHNASQLFGLEM